MLRTIDPAYGPKTGKLGIVCTAGTGNGDLVQVMKFNKDKPLSTAEAEGLAAEQAHVSYDVAFMGSLSGDSQRLFHYLKPQKTTGRVTQTNKR